MSEMDETGHPEWWTVHAPQGGCPSVGGGRVTMCDSGRVGSRSCRGPTSAECWLLFCVPVSSHTADDSFQQSRMPFSLSPRNS